MVAKFGRGCFRVSVRSNYFSFDVLLMLTQQVLWTNVFFCSSSNSCLVATAVNVSVWLELYNSPSFKRGKHWGNETKMTFPSKTVRFRFFNILTLICRTQSVKRRTWIWTTKKPMQRTWRRPRVCWRTSSWTWTNPRGCSTPSLMR